jgi:hypothetical protein
VEAPESGPHVGRLTRNQARRLPPSDASARISAYIYGNIIAFAVLVPLDAHAAENIHALSVTAGGAVTTFFAHLLAELVGSGATDEQESAATVLRREFSNSMPIITTVGIPCLLLGASAVGLLPGGATLLAAQGYLLIRIALVGLVIERLRTIRISPRGLLAGLVVALMAALVVVGKANLGH